MNHRRLERNIRLDYINTFITNLNMQSSIWVLYLAYCGLNLMQIGLLEGLYHATSIICEIPSGAVADLIGRKKSMVLSRICIAISCIIMLLSKSFWLFGLSFIIQALGNNFNSGSEEALVYDSMKCLNKEEEYMRVYGRLNVIVEVSQAMATLIGGILAEKSYIWCYVTCVVIAMLALVPVVLMAEPLMADGVNQKMTDQASDKVNLSPTQVIAKHLRTSFQILTGDKRILRIITYYAVVFASYTLMFFYSQQYYSEFGLNKIEISIIQLFIGGISCLGAILSEKIFKQFGNKIADVGALMIAVAYICYGWNNLAVSIAVFMAASFANSVLYPVQSDALNKLIPSEQRATLISVNSMFFSIAMIISFPAAGVMADQFGLSRVFTVMGGLLVLFIGFWKFRRK
ncbi:MAG: MFS transporter [Clostridiales bacterium]|nr:MFS transporter [Clostridiales bacterium]